MNNALLLTRDEMKHIMAGSAPCRAYSATTGWSACISAGWAQSAYNYYDDITGYCCASCGSGGFSNATPCDGESAIT